MIYTAGHPMLIVCDSKKDGNVNEAELEDALNDLQDFLLKFISENTKFDPFCADLLYSNLSTRLRGDQCMISIKISYITELGNTRCDYIKDLDSKQFLHEFKFYSNAYNTLDQLLDLETFVLHTGDYKDLEFCLGFGENHRE